MKAFAGELRPTLSRQEVQEWVEQCETQLMSAAGRDRDTMIEKRRGAIVAATHIKEQFLHPPAGMDGYTAAARAAIYVYTQESMEGETVGWIYQQMNKQLMRIDKMPKLEGKHLWKAIRVVAGDFYSFARLIFAGLQCQWAPVPGSITLYRGLAVPESVVKKWPVGRFVMFPAFQSFSVNPDVAAGFALPTAPEEVAIDFRLLSCRRPTVAELAGVHKKEEEVLLHAGSIVRIEKIEQTPATGRYTVSLVDLSQIDRDGVIEGIDDLRSRDADAEQQWKQVVTRLVSSGKSTVERIGRNRYRGWEELKVVEIPQTVVRIDDGAFASCPKLVVVEWGKGCVCTNIGTSAFCGCKSLKEVEIPATVKAIGDGAFQSCVSLASLRFQPDSKLTVIREDAFWGCIKLGAVAFPASLLQIGLRAFYGCVALKDVAFGAGSKCGEIGAGAFEGCSALQSVNVPRNARIGRGAFPQKCKVVV